MMNIFHFLTFLSLFVSATALDVETLRRDTRLGKDKRRVRRLSIRENAETIHTVNGDDDQSRRKLKPGKGSAGKGGVCKNTKTFTAALVAIEAECKTVSSQITTSTTSLGGTINSYCSGLSTLSEVAVSTVTDIIEVDNLIQDDGDNCVHCDGAGGVRRLPPILPSPYCPLPLIGPAVAVNAARTEIGSLQNAIEAANTEMTSLIQDATILISECRKVSGVVPSSTIVPTACTAPQVVMPSVTCGDICV